MYSITLRLKRVLVDRGPAVAVALLLVGAAALGSAWWVYEHPPTTQVSDPAHEQTVRTSLDTTATATGATGLYSPGERLRNRPVYLQRAAPNVTVVLQTSRAAGTVEVDQRLVLETSAVHEGTTFWWRNRTLTSTESSGETVVSRATLNVTALRDRLAARQQTVGGAGSVEVVLRYRAHYDTGRYADTVTRRVPISLGSTWYSIETPSTTKTHQTAVTEQVTVPRSRMTYLGPGVTGAGFALAGLVVAALWVGRWRGADRASLTRDLQHRTYTEWISTGSLTEFDDRRSISMASLEDLVDVAIDTDRRVVYDPARDQYAVVDDAAVYRYCPPETGSERATGEN